MKEITYTFNYDNPMSVQNFLMGKVGLSHRLLTKLKRQSMGMSRNGVMIRSIDMLEKGDKIVLRMIDEKFLEGNSTLNVPIAFENENIIIFNKPVNMPVHPSIKHQGDTLGNFFASLYPNLTFRPINRLDRDTSGLCAVAKNPHYANLLQGSIEKTYYAVVCGVMSGNGTINKPIARKDQSIILRQVDDSGQRSITHYKVIGGNSQYTLLEIHLETGRTHQIRVHFSYIGFPLAGDELYGGSTNDINCQALHCGELRFIEPITNVPITIKSDIRSDMKSLLK